MTAGELLRENCRKTEKTKDEDCEEGGRLTQMRLLSMITSRADERKVADLELQRERSARVASLQEESIALQKRQLETTERVRMWSEEE